MNNFQLDILKSDKSPIGEAVSDIIGMESAVSNFSYDEIKHTLHVTIDDSLGKVNDILKSIVEKLDENNFHVKVKEQVFQISGLSCQSCVLVSTKTLKKLNGVLDCKIDLEKQTATITYIPTIMTPKEMKKSLSIIGFDLKITE